ncbi:hypothetical protein ABID21_002272 [Pseudorhizobium tarimense]|uniref:Uncharacterized protein n=1 Tax=Pseudorhizobium tarimense TaxID=1079109 RepID=A0ABV2H6I5_9HYPH|nr:hypothetical protein [Pseudorhizobium tarimense]MCJ8519500.1 hypothetical protein [Pseudorhizobium tarimense]
MSEIQNRAVDLMKMDPDAHPMTVEDLRDNFFKASFALYCSLGGSEAKAKALLQSSGGHEGDVATLVGELMVTTAGVSHLQDMDMMQAAYNTLRRRYQQLSSAA